MNKTERVAALSRALQASGLPHAVEDHDGVALVTGALVSPNPAVRRAIVGLAREYGFTHVALVVPPVE